jgi:hypothetical protein
MSKRPSRKSTGKSPAPAGNIVTDRDVAEVLRVAIDKAKAGDKTCILVVERHWGRHDRPVIIDLPDVVDAQSLAQAQGRVIAATAQGRLTPRQGLAFSTMLEFRRRALETVEYEAQLSAIEESQSRADKLKDEFKAQFMSQ